MRYLHFTLVLVFVLTVHTVLLSSSIKKEVQVVQPKAKVHHITLSAIRVKEDVIPVKEFVPTKPVPIEPIVEPIVEKLLPPKPKPIVKEKKVKKKVVEKKKKIIKKRIVKKMQKAKPKRQKVQKTEAKVSTASLKDAYIHALREKIQRNLVYPNLAKRMRMEGVIYVTFTVFLDGSIHKIRVRKGTKNILKKGAMQTLRKIALKAIPKELQVKQLELTLPISFKLIKG